MDDILSKEIDHNNIRALDNLKYNNFENTHSEDEDDFEDISCHDVGIKSEMEFDMPSGRYSRIKTEIKEEILDLGVDIIMPEAPNPSSISNNTLQQSVIKPKKDLKSKKEMEEEEREKMQVSRNVDVKSGCSQFMANKNTPEITEDTINDETEEKENCLDNTDSEIGRRASGFQDITDSRREGQQMQAPLPKKSVNENQQEVPNDWVSESLQQLKQCNRHDSYSTYGEYIATELRKYDPITLAHVKHAISNILFEADTGMTPKM